MKNASAVLLAVGLLSSPAAAVEERIGPEIILDFADPFVSGGPAVASDGLGAYVVWIVADELRGARIDGAGNVSGPFVLATATTGRFRDDPAVASSGHGALVAWAEEGDRYKDINVILLDVDGRPVHDGPLTLDRHGKTAVHVHVAFDGVMYHVLWQRTANARPRNFTQRVGTDGSRWTRRTSIKARGMTRYPYEPNVACLGNGQCLLTWAVHAGADRVQAVRLVGDEIIDSDAIQVLDDTREYDVVAGEDQYLVLASRSQSPCGQSHCPVTAVAARVAGDGTALEFNGFAVDNPPGGPDLHVVESPTVAFDGQSYLTAFMSDWSPACSYNAFGARITPNGTVDNPDVPGSVISDGSGVARIDIAGIRAAAVAAWSDRRDPSTCHSGFGRSIRAQLVFPHEPAPPLPVRDIGAIGTLSLAEQQALRFTVGTPGLDPGTTAVTVTNMPDGAIFDAATRTFQWLPHANQSGAYFGVHFEASDATQTISEDVTIDVSESSLSLCGVVESSGVRVPSVAVRLKGGGGKPRTVLSDSEGRFCFFHLIQAAYKLSIDKLSRRDYAAERLSWAITDGDVDGLIMQVRPR